MRERLIALYAAHAAAAVKATPEYAALAAAYADTPEFQSLRDEIEQAKATIEVWFGPAATEREQLMKAIGLLKSTRKSPRERDLYYELITAAFAKRWSPERQAYLLRALEAVRLKQDYFLSYTTRYLAPGAINPVNQDYRHLIRKQLGKSLDADQRANLLAQAVHNILGKSATGFLFEQSQYDNSVTMEKLKRELDDSMVFVQLVQTVMFEPDEDGRPNYCFWEWQRARARFGNREEHLLYIVAEPGRTDLELTAPYVTTGNGIST